MKRLAKLHRQRRIRVLIGVAVAALATATTGCGDAIQNPVAGTSLSTSAQMAGPLTPAQLSRIARDTSASLGDKNPDKLQAVLTTRSRADQLTGDEVHDNAAAYLIEVHGTFSTAWESRPYGANVPPCETGTLSLVVNAYTGQQLDIGLGTTGGALAALGPVINLP